MVESKLYAVAKAKDGAITGTELDEANAANDAFCAPARSTGVRWGVSIGALFYFWAALHFLLMGRTMQRDLWTPDEELATS